jgi:hypothetical protein
VATIKAVTWQQFAPDALELAEFGSQRPLARPSYLATTRADGFPRVHPVNANVHGGHLSLYMFSTSPKVADLQRDPRFALHATVNDVHGGGGEISVRSIARLVDDPERLGDELASSGQPAREGYVRFELLLLSALVGTYAPGSDVPRRKRWHAT